MPPATRLTRATVVCFGARLRVLLDAFLAAGALLRAPALRAEVFFRAGPRLAVFLVGARLLVALRLPVLRAPAFLVLLRVDFAPALRAPPLRAEALRATVLRGPFDRFDFDPRFAPVREPAVRRELLRDDFLVAMLYSGTLVKSVHVNPSKNRAQMYNAQEFFAHFALYLSVRLTENSHRLINLMLSHRCAARGMLQSNRRLIRGNVGSSLLMVVALFASVTAIACGKDSRSTPNASAPVAGKLTATAVTPSTDTDQAARGTGLPAGYSALFDHSEEKPSDVSYTEKEPGRWEVKTGPAHILFSPSDTVAKSKYSVSATFEQLEAPAHPEAFGVFIGGSNLNSPKARYTYFLVRGDGEYMIKVRDGANTRTVIDWTAQPSIPKQDVTGKGLYGIKIDVSGKSASFSVNGAPITTISGKDIPFNGITGVRINHNLHLIVTPVSVIR
jgi:hypothetical protein